LLGGAGNPTILPRYEDRISDGPVLVVSNHRLYDAPILMATVERSICFVLPSLHGASAGNAGDCATLGASLEAQNTGQQGLVHSGQVADESGGWGIRRTRPRCTTNLIKSASFKGDLPI